MKPAYLDESNPITAAVLPLKVEAFDRAEKDARALAARYLAKLEECGMDLDKAFPRPDSFRTDRKTYQKMMSQHKMGERLTTYTKHSRSMRDPNIRAHKPENVEAFVTDAIKFAGDQYDAFVAKLIEKVGECVSATLTGSHVWGHSILTVTKADGSVERWKTQQIVNQSVLGTLFNQWPTRKVK